MAAGVVRVTSHHGAADDLQTADSAGTTIYFKTADTDSSGGGVAHNAGGTNYSWIKQLEVYVFSAPTNSIGNLKCYATGTAVAAIDIKIKTSGTYTDPTVQAATALGNVTSAYLYTATSPLSLNGSFTTSTDTAPKFIGDFIQLQLAVGNAAVANNIVLGNLIVRWDEM